MCIVMPRYLCVCVLDSYCEWLEQGNFIGVCKQLKFKVLHFSGLKSICHVVTHCLREFRSVWSSPQSSVVYKSQEGSLQPFSY